MISEIKKLDELTDSLKQYLMLNVKILKLEIVSKVSSTSSSVAGLLIVSISVFLFVFTLSIGLGFYLSELLGDSYSGFAIIAAFYFLLAIVLSFGRKRFIEKPLRDKIVTKLLEEKES